MKYKLSKNLKSKIRGNRLKKITELKIKQRTDLFFNKNQKIPDFSDKIINDQNYKHILIQYYDKHNLTPPIFRVEMITIVSIKLKN